MEYLIAIIGASITTLLGVLAVLFPVAVTDKLGIAPQTSLGTLEIRATYGGMFLGWGAIALWLQTAEVFIALGCGWCIASLIRLLFTPVRGEWTTKNMVGIVFEGLIGIMLLSVLL